MTGPVLRMSSFGKNFNSLVTCGVRHMTFWEIKGTTLKSQKGIFGGTKRLQTAVSIGIMGKDTIVTGMADGSLYRWDGHKLNKDGVKKEHGAAITAMYIQNVACRICSTRTRHADRTRSTTGSDE